MATKRVIVGQWDFRGGLNNRDAPHLIRDDQVSDAKSCLFEPDGTATIRGGFTASTTAATTSNQTVGDLFYSYSQQTSTSVTDALLVETIQAATNRARIINRGVPQLRWTDASISNIAHSSTATIVTLNNVYATYLFEHFASTASTTATLLYFNGEAVKRVSRDKVWLFNTSYTTTATTVSLEARVDVNLPYKTSTTSATRYYGAPARFLRWGDNVFFFAGPRTNKSGLSSSLSSLYYKRLGSSVFTPWGGIKAPRDFNVAQHSGAGSMTSGKYYKVGVGWAEWSAGGSLSTYNATSGIRWKSSVVETDTVHLSTTATAIVISNLPVWKNYNSPRASSMFEIRQVYRSLAHSTLSAAQSATLYFLKNITDHTTTSVVITESDSKLDTTITPPTDHDPAPDDFYIGCVHEKRIFAVRWSYQNRVYYSGSAVDASGGLNEPLYWPAENYIEFGIDTTSDYDKVMGMISFKRRLYVFRRNQIWVLDDSNTDPAYWRFREVGFGVGASGRVALGEEAIYFATCANTELKVYRLSGGGLQDITGDLKVTVKKSGDTYGRADCFYKDDRLYVAVGGDDLHIGSTTEGADIYAWHKDTKGWSPLVTGASYITGPAWSLTVGEENMRKEWLGVYVSESSNDRYEGTPWSGSTDNGDTIEWYVVTRDIDGGARWRSHEKTFEELKFEVSSTSGFTKGEVFTSLDGGSWTAQKIDNSDYFTCSAGSRKIVTCRLAGSSGGPLRGHRLRVKFRLNENAKDITLHWWDMRLLIHEVELQPEN